MEDERDAPAAQDSRRQWRRLELERAVEQPLELVGRNLVAGKEVAGQEGIVIRVLTWNLFHGRDFPPPAPTHADAKRPLLREFAEVLSRERWDIALLQEAPPRWLEPLGRACRASGVSLLTSRNEPRRPREWIAERRPDLIKSNEGGSNQILWRSPWRFTGKRSRLTVAMWPERRRVVLAELEHPQAGRVTVANMHLTAGDPPRAAAELRRAREAAGPGPAILGGDLNVRPFQAPAAYEGLGPVTGPKSIDHVFGIGLEVVEPPRRLEPERRELRDGELLVRLSDHAPVVAAFSVG